MNNITEHVPMMLRRADQSREESDDNRPSWRVCLAIALAIAAGLAFIVLEWLPK